VLRLSPPLALPEFHEGVLREILDERAVSSRARQTPRGIKRKMSNWPLRKQGTRTGVPREMVVAILIAPGVS